MFHKRSIWPRSITSSGLRPSKASLGVASHSGMASAATTSARRCWRGKRGHPDLFWRPPKEPLTALLPRDTGGMVDLVRIVGGLPFAPRSAPAKGRATSSTRVTPHAVHLPLPVDLVGFLTKAVRVSSPCLAPALLCAPWPVSLPAWRLRSRPCDSRYPGFPTPARALAAGGGRRSAAACRRPRRTAAW
jgi:hypothetical protein